MQVTNTGSGSVTLTDPQAKVAPGDTVTVPDPVGRALVARGDWEQAKPPPPTDKKKPTKAEPDTGEED